MKKANNEIIKKMTAKELTFLIEAIKQGRYDDAKELVNTKELPDVTEAQAMELERIDLVPAYTFEDFYYNPAGRLTMHPEYSTFETDTQNLAYVSSWWSNLEGEVAFGIEVNDNSDSYLSYILEVIEASKSHLESFLSDIKEYKDKAQYFCRDKNIQLVQKILIARKERKAQYHKLDELELMVQLMNERDESVKAELQEEALRRVQDKKKPKLTHFEMVRGDDVRREGMTTGFDVNTYSGDFSSPLQSVLEGFNNRAINVPVSEVEL
ncbi:TPA: hypothetical protein GRI80_14850 [Vibrio parahaemolyticus]|uniref:hypothetical protein n=1 Tax=Vibrio parahaemolyticus TaxID=670 RepID=UPI000B776B98|nr:hypothetical protein [Vibrio parahaemolyticus]AWA88769.1 hypothetical protein BSG32_06815 [Vibrio parahaemolyticus]EGQ9758823.1 hypothetical protein [Vibrio parahaemolyticus]EII5813522.1 hypothetical protein [Vibrio parahaemolyticus]EJX1250787.1 hypothetical protein [Vibrio parahaemolyticus]EKA7410790.1 hypothetical protein [Vibrio parahaemolyticus]